MDKYILSLEMLVVVGMYSLVWFVVGLLIGQRVPVEKAGGSGQKKRRRRNGGNVELYVGNLPYDVKEKDIRVEFRQFGRVASVRLIKNKFNGKSKGYGFVEMNSRNDAEVAIRKMNNKDIMGRRIIVNEAKTNARG